LEIKLQKYNFIGYKDMPHSLKKRIACDEIYRLLKLVPNPHLVSFKVDIPCKQIGRYALDEHGAVVFRKCYYLPIPKN